MTDNMRQAIHNQKEKGREKRKQERELVESIVKTAVTTVGAILAML